VCKNKNTDFITNLYLQVFGITPFQGDGTRDEHYFRFLKNNEKWERIISFNFFGKLITKLNRFAKIAERSLVLPKFGQHELRRITIEQMLNFNGETVRQLIVELRPIPTIMKSMSYIASSYANELSVALNAVLEELQSLCKLLQQENVRDFLVHMHQKFVENLREIASNRIGRMLLYRLFIEICRCDEQGVGTMEDIVLEGTPVRQKDLNERNQSRKMEVVAMDKDAFAISMASEDTQQDHSIFKFSPISQVRYKQVMTGKCSIILEKIGEEVVSRIPVVAIKQNAQLLPTFSSVFHELLHWFHALRNIKRFKIEKTSDSNKQNLLTNSTLGAFYYFGLRSSSNQIYISNTSMPWRNDRSGEYNQEEHRTICGAPLPQIKKMIIGEQVRNDISNMLEPLTEIIRESPQKLSADVLEMCQNNRAYSVESLIDMLDKVIAPSFFNGDELSENMLITTIPSGLLRDGHTDLPFFDDPKVCQRISRVALQDANATLKLEDHCDTTIHWRRIVQSGFMINDASFVMIGVGNWLRLQVPS
jgi:hypothetical protein